MITEGSEDNTQGYQHRQGGSVDSSGGRTLKDSASWMLWSSKRERFASTRCWAISSNISWTPSPDLHDVLNVALIKLWHCSL